VADLTRRSFLQNAPATAATLSVLPVMPTLAASHHLPEGAAPNPPVTGTGSMVIHVNNVATGQMTLLVGARAVSLRDPRLVARFMQAAR
jgi:hypothetical protein